MPLIILDTLLDIIYYIFKIKYSGICYFEGVRKMEKK